jgi:hypothetical protein
MSELRRAIIAALNEYTNGTGHAIALEEIVERHVAAVVVPAEFDVRKVAIAATGDVAEGGWVPIYAESVAQCFEALCAAADRTNAMRERGDMFAEASRNKAGWLLETRRTLAQVIAERDALALRVQQVREFVDRGADDERHAQAITLLPSAEIRHRDVAEHLEAVRALIDVPLAARFSDSYTQEPDAERDARIEADVVKAGQIATAVGKAMANACDRIAIDIMAKAGVVCPVMGEVAP